MSFKKFGIWGNTDKKIFWKILPEILSWASKNNLKPFLTKRIFEKGSFNTEIINSKSDFNKMDFMLVLGGDGTFLPLVILPDITFQDGNPLIPTLEGQYIIKNIIIITAALIIGRSYLKIKLK